VYNDAVNSPEMKKWLGKVVGGEAEDLSRHDKWLCMMYPRLALLKEFLREDGAIFVSIDDVEVGHLRLLMNEVFGERNFLANFVWQSKDTPKPASRWRGVVTSLRHCRGIVTAKRHPPAVPGACWIRRRGITTAKRHPPAVPGACWIRRRGITTAKRHPPAVPGA
jgi:hypothetical protein